jgi:hypothetical protein
MAMWRDPLDELIADVERSMPAAAAGAFEMPPAMEDYCVAVQSILSRYPAERQRLASDPAVRRVMEYHERLARAVQSTGLIEAQQ